MKPYAPLGMLYLSSHLRSKRLRCRDLRLHIRLASGAVVAFSTNGPPAVLGIYANLMTRANVLEIIGRAQRRRVEGDPRRAGAGQLSANEYLDCGRGAGRRGRRRDSRWKRLLATDSIRRWRSIPGLYLSSGERLACPHRPRPADSRSRRAALARPRAHRYRPVSGGLARTSWHGICLGDHGARLPLSVPLVQPFRLRQNAPAPLAASRGG